MTRSVDTSVPPFIADLMYAASPEVNAAAERAVIEIATTDGEARAQSRALGRFLLRSESVASSRRRARPEAFVWMTCSLPIAT